MIIVDAIVDTFGAPSFGERVTRWDLVRNFGLLPLALIPISMGADPLVNVAVLAALLTAKGTANAYTRRARNVR